MKNYDIEIAECKGNPKSLNKIKNELRIKYLLSNYISNYFSKTDICTVQYQLSSAYKELGYKKKSVSTLKKLFLNNRESNFFLVSLISAIKKYGNCDNFYYDLISMFSSKLNTETYYYEGNNAEIITGKIRKNGFIILKNFFDENEINLLRHNFEKNISFIDKIVRKNNIDPDNWVYPLYMISNYQDLNILKRKIETGIDDNWFLNKYFDDNDSTFITNNLINKIKNSFLNDVISKYIANNDWSLYQDYSMARKITASSTKKEGYAKLHQDSRIQLIDKHYLTFWIPFNKVGKSFAPTLGVIPTFCNHFYPDEYLSFDDFPSECIQTPELNVGDIWLHDSFTLHATDFGSKYSGHRHSVDLRFF